MRRMLAFFPVVLTAAILSGCGGSNRPLSFRQPEDETLARARRPQELTLAIQEIEANQGAQAEKRLDAWLELNQASPYFAEAWYLKGQAQAAQGNYEAAKKSHDVAEDNAPDRESKALALLARADANYAMEKYGLASRQYMELEMGYRDVTVVRHDEVLYKLGKAHKANGQEQAANYWFNRVIEHYAVGEYAVMARNENSRLNEGPDGQPIYYALQMGSYESQEKAQAEADIYAKKGYADVRVMEDLMRMPRRWNVLVGKYLNRNAAKRAQEDAELSGLDPEIWPGVAELQ